MAYNECFVRNAEQAKLILVIDTDETFLQPKLELYENFESKSGAFKFFSDSTLRFDTESEVNTFKRELKCDTTPTKSISSFLSSKFPKDVSLYFPQVIMLNDELAEEIFFKIELTLSQQSTNNGNEYPLRVSIRKNANFLIVINDTLELNYARNLAGLYRHLIRPFLSEHAQRLAENESNRMRRFLYVNVGDVRGKSFVSTKMNDHLSNSNGVPIDGDDVIKNSIAYNQGYYVSHFRNSYKLNNVEKSMREFGLDLNYFACYVRPMIEERNRS
jgi:hypothetical protein